MKIRHALFMAGKSAFFFDDQQAIKQGARHSGFAYEGEPVTPGFAAIRQAGESVCVLLLLEDGAVAEGDCAAVQYSGVGGRDPLFLARRYVPLLRRHVAPRLEGMPIAAFREMAEFFESMDVHGRPLHTAIRYGLSQALLQARALEQRRLPCEVLCEEYGLKPIARRVPVFGQTGDARYDNADKMILKGADVLPHGLINNLQDKLGRQGEKLRAYIQWLVRRIRALRPSERYAPTLHIDVYGTLGVLFAERMDQVAEYLASLEKEADAFPLYIEGPVDMGGKARQIEALQDIRAHLRRHGARVKIVADEWCNTLQDIRDFTDARACDMVQIKTPDLGGIQNTVESVLYCRARRMEAYQGGTCNETDVSARACVHAAMAARPQRLLAKPGMGFDEGYSIVHNEMQRIIHLLRHRKEPAS